MNSKIVMTLSAFTLGVIGMALTFLPHEIAALSGLENNLLTKLILQITGSMYFAFALVNWMSKDSIIGGIYNRPIAIGNYAHFFIGTFALVKGVMSIPDISYILWAIAILYLIFTILFAMMVFRHPARGSKA